MWLVRPVDLEEHSCPLLWRSHEAISGKTGGRWCRFTLEKRRMKKTPLHLFVFVVLWSLLLGTSVSCPGSGSDRGADRAGRDRTVTFGFVPAVSEGRTQQIYAPLVSELSRLLGRPVQFYVAPSYEALGEAVLNGRLQLAQVSSWLYTNTLVSAMHEASPVRVLVQERRTSHEQYMGVFVVKQDSPARALKDLEGKTVAYVDPQSAAGYYHPRLRLRSLGYDPDHFFGTTVFAGSHENVIAKVASGQADVGTVSEQSAAQCQLRIIDRTAPIPEDAVVSGGGLADREYDLLRNFFLEAHHNPALAGFLTTRGIARYSQADASAYQLP
jgi:phosphate/phosphite/phosphonate ABC transporter binding protein